MKAKKLPSGSYRVRLSVGKDAQTGKYIYKSFTADTAKEAERMAYEWEYSKTVETSPQNLTLDNAMEQFNQSKKYILSPTTYANYECLRKNSLADIAVKPIQSINNSFIQNWINYQSLKVTPKTIRNRYAYLCSVLKVFRPELKLDVTLPKKKLPEIHVVTDDEMKQLLKATEGTEIGLAIRLAAFIPARRSEICALTKQDVKGNFITINKAMVQNDDGDWVIKQPKSFAGYRTVEMPPDIIKMIPKNADKIVSYNPDRLYQAFKRELKKLGMDFRFHDLRHYGATFLHAQGVPDKYIMQRGGWSSAATLQNIYTHCLPEKTDEATKSVISKLNSLME